MAGLSGLVILVVASLGFTPRPATDLNAELETTLTLEVPSLVRAAREQQTNPVRHDSSAAFHIVSVEAIDGQLNRPTSSLRFLVRARFPTSRETDEARQDPAPTLRFFAERFASYGDAKMLSVTLARPAAAPPSQEGQPDPRELFFDITTQPTKYTLAAWPHDMTVLFGAFKLPLDTPQPVGLQVLLIEHVLVNFLGASVAVLVSIIITGFFIPNMLRKGTIDMLLVKPIHRPTLLIYKYI